MNKVLSDLFHVKGRFRRSVHLERDFYTNENLLEGYVVTATARDVLGRVISALENGNSSKVWSLTGPYGSGKSAFALFTANLLGNAESSKTKQALALLEQGDIPLHKRFSDINGNGRLSLSGFCPILISGERAPISIAILRALEHGLTSFNGISRSDDPLPKIRTLLTAAEKGKLPQASEITKIFESAMCQIKKHEGTGLLLVIDELGKFLEYASQYPVQGDVFVLQELAEFAARSEKTPLFLLTILHQAFEMYAQHTAKSQREEWAKVQGRFEDIPFTEPIEQVLCLVGTALEKSPKISWDKDFNTVIELGLKIRQLDEKKFTQLLKDCLPLHPTVALLIGPLFRRFAQNERSLFAFLSSSEPYGLQDFLANQRYDGNLLPMFSLSDLYDYLNMTQGNRLYTSNNSKKWAEIEAAINWLPNPCKITVKLIKTIGLLGITGEVITSLKASKRLLHYALDDNSESFTKEFDAALTELEKHSIITYRRYNDTYVLWEGSDIDIEKKLREAATHVDTKVTLATNLSRYMPTRPLVARRHLHQKGTLRHFVICYTDLENFDVDLGESLDDKADGSLIYAFPTSEHEAEQLRKKAKKVTQEAVLIAIPDSMGSLQESVSEIARLHWIQQNTPELQNDRVARRELSARITEVETDVEGQLKAIFSGDSENSCIWFYKGKRLKNINSQRERNKHLSKICNQVYSKTPILQNELINRRKISGTVTAARRQLIQYMLENEDKKDLEISGYPPEMSIYRSLLLNSGIHRSKYGKWGFHPPNRKNDKNKMKHTWDKIEEFLTKCENERQPIEELYKCLTEKPYGIRRGPLPILLCAALLCYKTEIALYENGSFIPDWSMPVFERFLKAPQQFELKRFRMTGIRSDLFSQFSKVFNQPTETQKPDLLAVVTPLMHTIAQLPKYTLTTQELSGNAKNLRKVVLNAREPDELLFKQLPEAFGCAAFGEEMATDSRAISEFFRTLRDALSELEQAYDILLNSVEQLLAEAFGLAPTSEKRRKQLVKRAEPLLAVTIEMDLKGFLIQVCSGGHDFSSWLEAIATYLAKKPPSAWVEADKAQFEINLFQIARKFRHFETVSYEKLATNEQTSEMENEIKNVFDNRGVDNNPELRIAILARISQKWIQQLDE